MAGNDPATEALADLPRYKKSRKDRRSVWNAYKKNPNFPSVVPSFWTVLKELFRARKSNLEHPLREQYPIFHIIAGINTALDGDSVQLVEVVSEGLIPGSFIKRIQRARSSGAAFLLTWKSLGLRAINRLFSHRAYSVGLTNQDLKVDGRLMGLRDFPIHDLGHVGFNESVFGSLNQHEKKSHKSFDDSFYEQFRYDDIILRLSERDQLFFDFGYFFYFHESVGNIKWGSEISDFVLTQVITKEKIQIFYQDHFFEHDDFSVNREDFSFIFGDDGKVTVSYLAKPYFFFPYKSFKIVDRLLDEDDMRNHLPIEIEQQIAAAASPDEAKRIAARFAEEFLTPFLQFTTI